MLKSELMNCRYKVDFLIIRTKQKNIETFYSLVCPKETFTDMKKKYFFPTEV
jgi:hypothetical protein